MSYEGLYIEKGGVALDIPLCDYSSTLMTLHLLYDCYIQLSTLELPLDKTLHKICTCTHVRQNRLEQAMQYITMTWKIVGIPTLWHPHDGRRWQTNAKLGIPRCCLCTLWWNISGSKLLPPSHLSTLLGILFPTHLITYASLSWVWLDQRHTDAWCLHGSPSLCWWLCTSTHQSMSQAPVELVPLSLPSWVSQ